MEKIPTAVEWFANEIVSAIQQGDKDFVYWKLQTSLLKQALEMEKKQQRMDKVKFAKMHVEAALKAASERADLTDNGRFPYVDKASILNSYSLSNIK